MYPASFGYYAARSVDEAVALLERHGDEAKLLAGGMSLIPAMKLRLAQPVALIDLGPIAALRGVRQDGDTLVIGALTLHADVAASDLVRERLPGLAEAAERIGDVQVRNRGTIGGSVAHADPKADLPVILVALDTAVVVQGPGGARTVPIEAFFVDYYTTALEPNEVLTEVRVPLPGPGTGTAYAKLGHPASGYVVVSAGVKLTLDAADACTAARVAIGGVSSVPLRATATEAALVGQPLSPEVIAAAAAHAAADADPQDDPYASAEYQRHVAGVYARRAIEAAAARARR
ncbi:MAG TPA: xanthine dehydrogenase family protein subunit M [Chloroflexota bacterium]|jgi:carbon-monoxide dehydrogenase medium subunit